MKNTDELAGFEVGRDHGRERIGGKLFDRLPPPHLSGQRSLDWRNGYRNGLIERARVSRRKGSRSLVSYSLHGAEHTEMMGGSRRSIVSRLEKIGVTGDVAITTPAGVLHNCGI